MQEAVRTVLVANCVSRGCVVGRLRPLRPTTRERSAHERRRGRVSHYSNLELLHVILQWPPRRRWGSAKS